MIVRIGKVTNIYPAKGKVKVLYEDRNQASAEIPMLTFNKEFEMPAVGDRVLTLHMENGRSKAFCLGTYWNTNNLPPESDYKKDLGGGAYIERDNSAVVVYAPILLLSSAAGTVNLNTLIELIDKVQELKEKVADLENAIGGNG